MHHIRITSTFQFHQSIFHAPPGPCLVQLIKNLVTIVTLLVIFISMCVHITYFIIIHCIHICVNRNLHNIIITYYLIIKIPTNQCTGRILTTKCQKEYIYIFIIIFALYLTRCIHMVHLHACMFCLGDAESLWAELLPLHCRAVSI